MLNFTYTRNSFIKDEDLEKRIEENEGILEAAQKGHVEHRDSLGWLDVDEWTGKEWLRFEKETARQIQSFADAFVMIGVGGSNNSARAVMEALGSNSGVEMIYAGNTLSPHELWKVLEDLDGKNPVMDCIAKNFETLEPGSSFRMLRSYLKRRYGTEDLGKRIYTCGTPGSHLDELSKKEGWNFFPFPEDIGGRYTALSPVHMVPMAVAGIDIDSYSEGARDMMKLLRTARGKDNPALVYATLRNMLYEKGKKVEVLSSFEPRLKHFFLWWKQLFAESEGKDGKGILPFTAEYSEELHSIGQYLQDGDKFLFETFIDVKDPEADLFIEDDEVDDRFHYLDGMDFKDVNRASFDATWKAHSEAMQTMKIEIDRIDAYHFGALFYFFEFSCYLSGMILGVNPFNQPGVEAYKKWMFDILGK